jgi:catechol 2,3-dioxygenase-like lactoylglutathione lyase family enzyme
MFFHSVVMNVADLDRSVDFYREIFGFSLVARRDQIAAMSAPDSERPQVIILRALETSGRVGGARQIGMRALLLEVNSIDALEKISKALDQRGCLVGKREGADWTAVVGHDPDRIAVVANASLGPGPITVEGWKALDEVLYSLGE